MRPRLSRVTFSKNLPFHDLGRVNFGQHIIEHLTHLDSVEGKVPVGRNSAR